MELFYMLFGQNIWIDVAASLWGLWNIVIWYSFGSSSHYMTDMKYHDEIWVEVSCIFVYAVIIETSYAYVILCILPRKLTWNLNITPFKKNKSSSKPSFLGSTCWFCVGVSVHFWHPFPPQHTWHHMNQTYPPLRHIRDRPRNRSHHRLSSNQRLRTHGPRCPGTNSTLWKPLRENHETGNLWKKNIGHL